MYGDTAQLVESAHVGVLADVHDAIKWHCHTRVDKFDKNGEWYDSVEVEGNMLMLGGGSALFSRLVGKTEITAFDNANARLGVGDSSTAESNTHTDLQATTNKTRNAMATGYPTHTDGVSGTVNQVVFRASFSGSEANYVWNEWGIFNGTATTGAAAGGRMLNRKVQALGTKASGTTWQLTVTLSLA